MFYVRGAENFDVKYERNCNGDPGHLPLNILKSSVSEMPSVPAFWEKNLLNSEGYETPYKNNQIKY